MSENKIELAKIQDLEALMELYKQCTRYLQAQNIDQWDDTYPDLQAAIDDIEAKELYIIKSKKDILATVVLNEDQDEQYKDIRWHLPSKKPLIIHRLCVSPNIQNRGFGKQLCLFAETFGRKNKNDIIRLDTYTGNPGSMNLYKKLGYARATGHCFYHGCSQPFICLEKRIQ